MCIMYNTQSNSKSLKHFICWECNLPVIWNIPKCLEVFPLWLLAVISYFHSSFCCILSWFSCTVRERNWPGFIHLHMYIQFCQHYLFKRLSFIHCMLLVSLWKIIIWLYEFGLISGFFIPLSCSGHIISCWFWYYSFIVCFWSEVM
jgi:hypothetical protein